MSRCPLPDRPRGIPTTRARSRSVRNRSRPARRAAATGSGGWGGKPTVEPFAVAALVWAIVSIVLPLVGTIVALRAGRARSRARSGARAAHGVGTQLVTAARIIAGAVIALWAIGLVAFVALGGDNDDNGNNGRGSHAAADHQHDARRDHDHDDDAGHHHDDAAAGHDRTVPPPTVITVIPPPPTTVGAPAADHGAPPPTTKHHRRPPRTADHRAADHHATAHDNSRLGEGGQVQAKLERQVGPSNRGVPSDERVVVQYTPGQDLLVTWAINNGAVGTHPTGTPDCTTEPTDPPPTTSSTSTTITSTSTTTTTSTLVPATSTTTLAGRTTQEQARYEAKQILASIRPQLTTLKLDVPGVQLVGTYPLDGTTDDTVVQVLYAKSTVQAGIGDYKKAFDVPPAEVVQCLNPAFELT